MRLELVREVTKKECPWLDKDLPAGTEVFLFHKCIGPYGLAVSFVEGEYPFFEVPTDSLSVRHG